MKFSFQLAMLCFVIFSSSCTSYKGLLNYNDSPRIPTGPMEITNFEPLTIQPNDIIRIRVSSPDPSSVAPFSLSSSGASKEGGGSDEYLVNSDGYIDFPTIGRISVKGLQIEEVKGKILEKLSTYFSQAPIVQVRLVNFKVNVNGEVRGPGSFTVNNDRLTIIEAITKAGDFTNYAMRDSILIIREQNGTREFGYVNFNSAEIFSSPYFYLQQNDVIYVRPDKTKVASVRDPASRFLPWISTGISVILLLFTIGRT